MSERAIYKVNAGQVEKQRSTLRSITPKVQCKYDQILTNLFWTPFKRKPMVANSTLPRLDEFIDCRMIYSIKLNRGYLKLVLIITKHDSLHDVQPPVS